MGKNFSTQGTMGRILMRDGIHSLHLRDSGAVGRVQGSHNTKCLSIVCECGQWADGAFHFGPKLHRFIWRGHRQFWSILHNRRKDISKTFIPLLGVGWICCLSCGPCWTYVTSCLNPSCSCHAIHNFILLPSGKSLGAASFCRYSAFLVASCCLLQTPSSSSGITVHLLPPTGSSSVNVFFRPI